MAAKKDPTISLYLAIHAVMREVGYVNKGGTVAYGNTNYKFAGEADMIKAIRPAMVDAGLMLIPLSAEYSASSKSGDIVNCTYTLAHIDGGSMIVAAVGQGKDVGDKAIPKALTGAFKYAMRQLFMIETGDDPDRHASGKTDKEVKARDKREARAEEIGATGYRPADVNRYLKANNSKVINNLNDGAFNGVVKALKTVAGKAKIDAFLKPADDQNSNDRAKDALG